MGCRDALVYRESGRSGDDRGMAQGWFGRGRKDAGRSPSGKVTTIRVDSVVFNPYQPRSEIDQDGLDELTDSVRQHGVLQPIIVRKMGGGYELLAGERRLRACKRAGLEYVPAVVRQFKDDEMALLSLVENLQREDLKFLEEAEGYRQLIERFGLTQEELARRLGRSQSTVANKLRLLKLPEQVRRKIVEGRVGERHARALLRLDDPELQEQVLNEVIGKGLTARETEELVDALAQSSAVEDRAEEERRRGRVVRVFKDVRIFLNSFRDAVRTLRDAGVGVTMDETDHGDRIELRVTIPKGKAQ